MNFADHFSQLAQNYSRYRPHYPAALFEYLATIAPGRDLAWDCGTGNGQAALQLVKYFDRVVATDASSEQINQAFLHDRITYRIEKAEEVSLVSGIVDLVTVAVAVHWFALDAFYQEVRRVLKPDGVLAVWTYHLPLIGAEIDQHLRFYYSEVLGDYWPARFHYVDEKYQTLPFPFQEVEAPEFVMRAEWDLNELVGFLSSWSATRKYSEQKGSHPLEVIWPALKEAWGDANLKREIRWPLYVRIGRWR
ncbi:MAG TPA: class I SAM-dependent methyltransferase [Anaerolineae bacterium]